MGKNKKKYNGGYSQQFDDDYEEIKVDVLTRTYKDGNTFISEGQFFSFSLDYYDEIIEYISEAREAGIAVSVEEEYDDEDYFGDCCADCHAPDQDYYFGYSRNSKSCHTSSGCH